ncbi:LysR family transcriptional regulator [Ruixingdingia sedimenti]|uniref:LysR family transcriptional regulator n=1 Tax=Ruixingdingia sedimenti TaxID=3073604 RepID=A0ABU1F9U3_9RHOB|nr:LysR family transcriptional regulator [Xinfangfangia sp. LG-4]MDR5653621.1 LysR family transcriptional regulator [Xinfangfangia sp. LG-4]
MESWDEVRTAWQVARLGTVSGAAEVLGVHHATVIRHIDALEKRLGTRLFQRHARGYTPTEAGRDLFQVAETTADQFGQLVGRIKGQGASVTGDLVVTAITGISRLLTPALVSFQAQHPGLTVRFLTDSRVFRLEYGEAHVAVRAGASPEEPDNVVQPFVRIHTGLYAARSYIERHGMPQGPADFVRHQFIVPEGDALRAPYNRWLMQHIGSPSIAFRATESTALVEAVLCGAGIGFLPTFVARAQPEVMEIMPARPEWEAPLWLVTHVDLHRTPKVQACLAHLKEAAKAWEGA